MKCRNCTGTVEFGRDTCGGCGWKVGTTPSAPKCPNCGGPRTRCLECGHVFDEPVPPVVPEKTLSAGECADAVARAFWLDYWRAMANGVSHGEGDEWIIAQTDRSMREESRQPLGLPKWAADRMTAQEREIGAARGDLRAAQIALTNALVKLEDMTGKLSKARASVGKLRAALAEVDKP